MKRICSIIFLILYAFVVFSQNPFIKWNFETQGRIVSSPGIFGNKLIIGSNDGNVYALNPDDGREIWKFETASPVRSSFAEEKGYLFFESGNQFYAINLQNGRLIWKYDKTDKFKAGKIDPWDYHHPTPVIHKDKVYFSGSDGVVYGFDYAKGILLFQFRTIDAAPFRATPVIVNNILYTGDWNGVVYAVDIRTGISLWTFKTFEVRPYGSFGPICSEIIVSDSLLFFGLRNPELTVLNAFSGKPAWKYFSRDGGWMSGDPLLYRDTLYIGGSDNHKLFAFNAQNGGLLWSFKFLFNCFSKPVIAGDYIVFTTGDAYANYGTDYGHGYLYAVKRSDGQIKAFLPVGGNIFTTPLMARGKIYLGSDDGYVYAIDSAKFLSENQDLKAFGYNALELLKISPNPFHDSISVSYKVNYSTKVDLTILDYQGTPVVTLVDKNLNSGIYETSWNGKDKSNQEVANGGYFIQLSSAKYYLSEMILKQD